MPLRLGAGAERHRVHVRHEQQPVLVAERAAAGQIDDQVAGLGRQRNARVGIVEADRLCRHADFLERRHDLLADLLLAAGHAFDGEKAHQPPDGGLGVDVYACGSTLRTEDEASLACSL